MDHMDPELARGFAHGDLDPAAQARWAAHLKLCAQCRQLVAHERSWAGMLKLGDESPQLDGAVDRLLARVEPPGPPLSWWQRWRAFLPAAALAGVLGIAIGVAWQLATTPSAAEDSAAELNISVQRQREIFIRLDALQTLRDDPWLADNFETVRWLDELIAADGGG